MDRNEFLTRVRALHVKLPPGRATFVDKLARMDDLNFKLLCQWMEDFHETGDARLIPPSVLRSFSRVPPTKERWRELVKLAKDRREALARIAAGEPTPEDRRLAAAEKRRVYSRDFIAQRRAEARANRLIETEGDCDVED